MKLNRRTYLKAGVVSTLSIGGLAGASVSAENATNKTGATGARQRGKVGCPQGTVLLAKYEWKGNRFVLAEGDGSAVTIRSESVVTDDDGNPVKFRWTATEPVCALTVKYGQETKRFEGGFEGTVDLGDAKYAISNVSFCEPRGGRAVLCELDMDTGSNAFNVETHVGNNECSDLGPNAVHVTSAIKKTSDYAHGMVNLLGRLGDGVKISELQTASFRVGEGPANSGAVPDEVYASLLTPKDELLLAITHDRVKEKTDGGDCSTASYDVLTAFESGNWSVLPISLGDLQTTSMAVTTARLLRAQEREGSLLPSYGDARLAGIGYGAGNTRSMTVLDRYYDDLTVSWDGETANFDFPAVVPMDISFEPETLDGDSGPAVTATLSFQRPEFGLSIDDVEARSVKLNAYRGLVPPVESGVAPTRSRTRDGALTARFRTDSVVELLEPGPEMGYAIVSGDFATTSGSSFFGVGRLSVD